MFTQRNLKYSLKLLLQGLRVWLSDKALMYEALGSIPSTKNKYRLQKEDSKKHMRPWKIL
jgi:hypothetical protein